MSATTPPTRTPRSPRLRTESGAVDGLAVSLPSPRALPNAPLVPNVLIPGVTHAGAAMLAADLGRHPEICLPTVKQIDHYTSMRYGRDAHGDLSDYDRHFANWKGQRYRIETSPVYFDGGSDLVEAVAEQLAGVRVIITLRDPADRLWTGYTDKLASGRLPRAMSFETFVDRCLALRVNAADRFEGNRHFRTLSGGFYIDHLAAWLETFGRRARVVFTEDLQDEPGPQVGALFDWLGLNPTAAVPPPDDDTNETGPEPGVLAQAFNRRLWPVLQRAPGPWRAADSDRSQPGRRVPRQSDRARNRVRSLYAGANRELASLLRDRGYADLPGWLANS
jgi:hypothetical protein